MPELPEVETTRRGILPHAMGEVVSEVIVRDGRLRWPVPEELTRFMPGATIEEIQRRGKYLLFRTDAGTLIAHLGMSGSLRVVTALDAPKKHDHVDIVLGSGKILRYNDPRRFGCLLWTLADPSEHELLHQMGPEPLQAAFDADYLYRRSRGRKAAVKTFIMDSYNFMTPVSEGKTRYYWFQLRNIRPDDEALSTMISADVKHAFEEDRAVLNEVQIGMAEKTTPNIDLDIDGGQLRFRRQLEFMITQEQSSELA